MVSVEEADHDVLQFLWVKDFKREMPEFKIYRFTRVVFGVSSSPFLLNATIRFHLEGYLKTNEVHVRRLLCSTYVDDIITGGETEEEAFELYVQSKQIFREGGFNLRKFLTNSKHLQEQIDPDSVHQQSVSRWTNLFRGYVGNVTSIEDRGAQSFGGSLEPSLRSISF